MSAPRRYPDDPNLGFGELSGQERKSVTHSDFWIPEGERVVYRRALEALNAAAVPYVVAGAYAIYEHTGIYRETKDLDLFVEPSAVEPAALALRAAGFRTRLEQPHWLAKATDQGPEGYFVDLIFGMGNGLATVDKDWFGYSRPAVLAATPVRVAPPEELIWHRLFINERHRQDMADIAHLIVALGPRLDWRRLVEKTGEHWPLLLAQLTTFIYVYPEMSGPPAWVFDELLARAAADAKRPRTGRRVTRGTLVSRFSFTIDVREWGFTDLRADFVREMQQRADILALARSEAFDERSADVDALVGDVTPPRAD